MDHIMFIVAVVVAVAIIVALLIAVARKHSKARKAVMKNAYKALLAEHNLAPTLEDEFSHRIIGLDTDKNVLVSIQHHGSETPHAVVLLDEVKTCEIRKSGHSVSAVRKNGQNVTEEFTNGISLSFMLRNGTSVEVPVYNEIVDGITARIDLQQTAEKWQQLIRVTIGKTG